MGLRLPTLTAALAAAALAFGMATPASAIVMGEISTADANDGVFPIYGTNARNGWFGADLFLFGGPTTVTVTFHGREAEFNNSFLWDGAAIFENDAFDDNSFSIPGVTDEEFVNVDSGLLPFGFATPSGDVMNGSNPDNFDPTLVNFFASFPDENATSGTSVILWLDDANDVDDNHDDMVISLSVENGRIGIVPLPASVFMLLAALGGLGLVSRRRSASA